MDMIGLRVSSLRLTDVNRRSLYIAVTLFGKTAWISWWPRATNSGRNPYLTAGVR